MKGDQKCEPTQVTNLARSCSQSCHSFIPWLASSIRGHCPSIWQNNVDSFEDKPTHAAKILSDWLDQTWHWWLCLDNLTCDMTWYVMQYLIVTCDMWNDDTLAAFWFTCLRQQLSPTNSIAGGPSCLASHDCEPCFNALIPPQRTPGQRQRQETEQA